MTESIIAIAMSLFPVFQAELPDHEPRVVTATWGCGDLRWIAPPEVNGGIYEGRLTSTCLVRDASGGGLAALDRMFLRQVAASRIIHSGPVRETYEGLPGVRYDVTVGGSSGQDAISMRQDVHVATNQTQRSLYVTLSKKIEGDGLASHVRRINIRIETLATQRPGTYEIRATNLLQAERPWYAPGGIFRDEAEQAQREQYLRIRNRTVAEMARAL